MARTAIVPVVMARDGGVSLGSGTAAPAAASGSIIANPGPYHLQLQVKNADTNPHTVIIRSGNYTGTPNGAANSSMLSPANTVFTQATVGDLSVLVAASDTEIINIETTDRFTQPDGSVLVDFAATATSVTIYAFTRPYVVA